MEDKTLNELLEDVKNNSQNPELVKDNKFYFQYEEKWYRCVMPNQKELAEANQLRNKIRIQLAQKGKKEGLYFKKDLIKLLKETGIDTVAMDEEIKTLRKDFIQISITGAKAKDHETEKIAELEKQANEIENKIKTIINEKAEHLSPAIENQAEDVWYKSLVASCTEKQNEEDKWEKIWLGFDKFQKDNSNLPYVAEAHLAALVS